MDHDAAALLILRARYLALPAARALMMAHRIEKVVRMDYRKAAEMAALSAEKMDDYPTIEELLERPRWW